MSKSGKTIGNKKFFDTYSWYVPGFSGVLCLLALILLGAVLGNVVNLCLSAIFGNEFTQLYGQLVAYPVMFMPAMMYAGLKSRTNAPSKSGFKTDSNNFGERGPVLCAVVLIPATMAVSFCTDAITAVMPQMPETLEKLLKSMVQGPIIINFIMVSLMAPLFEEWLCRGMVLRGLLGNGVKPLWAVVVSSLFFALIHANPWQAVPAFILGCFFGYVYYKTGSLKLTMLMHFTFNTFSLVLGQIDSLKDCDSWLEVIPTGLYWIIFAVCVLLVVLAVRFFSRIKTQSPQGNCNPAPALFTEAE